ncbi:MAG: hypothetical protein AAF488_14175 [Planctomycetota bacterium]
MKTRSLFLAALLAAPSLFANIYEIDAPAEAATPAPAPTRTVLGEAAGMTLFQYHSMPRIQMSGIASVENLDLQQVAYANVGGDADNNVVIMIYDEPTPNAFGVQVSINGTVLGNLPPNAGGAGFGISNVAAGETTIELSQVMGNSTTSATIEIVDDHPFAIAENVSCAEDGRCSLLTTFDNAGDASFLALFVNGNYLGNLPGDATGVRVNFAFGGPVNVGLLAVGTSEAGGIEYQQEGQSVSSCFVSCVNQSVPVAGGAGLAGLALAGLALGGVALRRRRRS